jgi:hypothetical protein
MSKCDLFAEQNKANRTVDTFVEVASASHAAATATKTGTANKHVHVTGVHASFLSSGLQSAAVTLTLTVGVTTGPALVFGVVNDRDITFNPPLRAPVGENVTAVLADGGSSVTGKVALTGFVL